MYLTIKQFADICRTTPRTIRFYEQSGLLLPRKVDQFSKYRYYEADQARDFFKIKLLQSFNVPLKGMEQAIKNYTEKSFLEERLESVQEEIDEKRREYEFLKNIKEFLFGNAKSKLKKEKLGPFKLFCMSVKGGRYDEINSYIVKMFEIAEKFSIPITEKQMIFYKEPHLYTPVNANLEVCLICENIKLPAGLILPQNTYFKTYQRQKVLTYDYKGPFEYLTFIHKKMIEIVQGRCLKDLPFDIHYKGPWNENSEFNYLTKVGYPV
ncbi:MerR family transcriptional regulator [Patescibacteria group bacterium]|nr:MerR family transcriptional regulator [Patescibacteria group bacterium]